jgi:hypothetical protein
MLTKLKASNFKLFDYIEIDLVDRVVFVGPNNSGKSSALQALVLWSIGVRKWLEKRGDGRVPKERSGVTINRRDLISSPIPSANLLWRDLHVRERYNEEGKSKTRNVLITLEVEGVTEGRAWSAALEFDYANEESFYCRSLSDGTGERREVPQMAGNLRIAYLPPMSGLASVERRHDTGAVDVLIGEGRTAEVLRNLCWRSFQAYPEQWSIIKERIQVLFGTILSDPLFVKERGEIIMSFQTHNGIELDLSASGRGQLQTLLLLAHMAANPGSVLLLDEPDAHLEILRQRQIYNVLSDIACETQSQILIASHSEVILNEAADRDSVIAFVGRPHRINDRGSQLLKALKEIGFENYLLAESTGWVLYLEGSTDLAILTAFAKKLNHRAASALERPFVHYVCNQPSKSRDHFHGLLEARNDLVGIGVYDRLTTYPDSDQKLTQTMWRRRELENYLCQRETLLAWARAEGCAQQGDIFASAWEHTMTDSIDDISNALRALGKPDPWSSDLKVSDDFLEPLFRRFFERMRLPNLLCKNDYHTLVEHIPDGWIDDEITEKLDLIANTASRAVLN